MNTNKINTKIRPANAEDRASFQRICKEIVLFTAEEIEFMDGLFSSFIAGEMEEGHAIIVVEDEEENVLGAAYYGPEAFADNVYNIYFIGVLPQAQGHGCGRKLMVSIEKELRKQGVRVLLVDTSSKDSLAKTRAFYVALGYELEARIREYYGEGEDKITFWKQL